jgi:hypothetical protein
MISKWQGLFAFFFNCQFFFNPVRGYLEASCSMIAGNNDGTKPLINLKVHIIYFTIFFLIDPAIFIFFKVPICWKITGLYVLKNLKKRKTERKQEFIFMLASKICWWKWCFNLYGCRDTHLGTLLLILLLIWTQGFHFLMEWDLFLMNSMRWSTWYCNVCLTSSELCLTTATNCFSHWRKVAEDNIKRSTLKIQSVWKT